MFLIGAQVLSISIEGLNTKMRSRQPVQIFRVRLESETVFRCLMVALLMVNTVLIFIESLFNFNDKWHVLLSVEILSQSLIMFVVAVIII